MIPSTHQTQVRFRRESFTNTEQIAIALPRLQGRFVYNSLSTIVRCGQRFYLNATNETSIVIQALLFIVGATSWTPSLRDILEWFNDKKLS